MVDREEIAAFVARIVAALRPDRAPLWLPSPGHANSRLERDRLVVLPFEGKAWHVASEIRCHARPKSLMDLLVRTPEQVRERASREGALLCETLREEEIVHEG